MKDLKNIPVIITGGGSGIGEKTAAYFQSQGAKVSRWDLKGGDIDCDVTSEDSVKDALDQTIKTIETPRILINCAGILIGKRVIGRDGPADLEHFHKTISVNLIGTFNVIRYVAAEMQKLDPVTASGERGIIINAASIAAFEGQIGQAAYAASKGGIVSMTLPLAREFASYGIRVMAIAPGAVNTQMMDNVPDDIRKSIQSAIPFPSRFAEPEEFAKLAEHIVQNEMLNGEIIRLDGAVRLTPK